jgi:hypothetical protein
MEARSQFAVKLLPSLADFAFLMPMAFLFGRMDGVKTLLSDWHGTLAHTNWEWIPANGWVPMHTFSFRRAHVRGVVERRTLAKLNALADCGCRDVHYPDAGRVHRTVSTLRRKSVRSSPSVTMLPPRLIDSLAGKASYFTWVVPVLFMPR